jgi:hypothetical protein
MAILQYNLHKIIQSDVFFLGFSVSVVYFSTFPCVPFLQPSHPPWFHHPNNIWTASYGGFLRGIISNPEDGSMFLRNVSISPNYTSLQHN